MKEMTTLLVKFGFTRRTALDLTQRALDNSLALDDVRGWITEAKTSLSLHNPLAFVRVRLEDGDKPPTTPSVHPAPPDRSLYKEWASPATDPRLDPKKGKANDD